MTTITEVYQGKELDFKIIKESVDELFKDWRSFKEKIKKLYEVSPLQAYKAIHRLSFIITFDYDIKNEVNDLNNFVENEEEYKNLREKIKEIASDLTFGDIISKEELVQTQDEEVTNEELEIFINKKGLPNYVLELLNEESINELKTSYLTHKKRTNLEDLLENRIKPVFEFLRDDGIEKISDYIKKRIENEKSINMRGFDELGTIKEKTNELFLSWKKPKELIELYNIKPTTINLERYIETFKKNNIDENKKNEIINYLTKLEIPENIEGLLNGLRTPLKRQLKKKFEEIKNYKENIKKQSEEIEKIKKKIKKYFKTKDYYKLRVYLELGDICRILEENKQSAVEKLYNQIETTLGSNPIYSINENVKKLGDITGKELIINGYKIMREEKEVEITHFTTTKKEGAVDALIPTSTLARILNEHNYRTQEASNPEFITPQEYETLMKALTTGLEISEARILNKQEVINLKAYNESITKVITKSITREQAYKAISKLSITNTSKEAITRITTIKPANKEEYILKKWAEQYLKSIRNP